jgi:uncharacterized repeat protein (TIGR02543 family)
MSRYRFTPPYLFIFLIFLFIFNLPTQAATFTVANLNDSGPGSLRQAVLDANANLTSTHTIEFQPGLTGTIILTSGEIEIKGRITINGPGQNVLVISGNKTSRVFNVSSLGATIRRLTIKEGNASDVGAGINNTGYLTLSNLTLSNNVNDSGSGGGIFNFGYLILSDVTLSDNKAALGGGIWNNGSLTVTHSTFSGNDAFFRNGGGIYNNSSQPLIISDSIFTGNHAYEHGGGIFNSQGTLTVINSVFSNNRVDDPEGGGGGIANSNNGTIEWTCCGILTVTHSTFSGNESAYGGGIYSSSSYTLTVTNSTLSGNITKQYGGGILAQGTTILTNSTVTGNIAIRGGGGIQNYVASTLTLNNSIVAGNIALIGKEIYGGYSAESSSNLFGENGVSGVDGATPSPSEIIAGPLSSVIGPLADNGGPTQTHALVAGSPAINAGNNSLIPTGITTDQRGDGFPRIVGGTVDIGAVEGTGGGRTIHSLTVITAGTGSGEVTSSPSGIDCGIDCSESYAANTVVTLTATTGFQDGLELLSTNVFAGWSGACTGTNATCTVTMDTAKTVTATFTQGITPTLTTTTTGIGSGTVSGAGNYAAGAMVTLTATPNTGSTFVGWSPSPCATNFAMPADNLACTATFTLNNYTVMATAGSGGSITPTSRTVNHGATTTFTVTPNSGYRAAVTGCSGTLSGTTYTTSAITSACTVNASFTTNSYALTVNKAGTGSGTVTSNPVGINCGSDCTESYGSSTSVTLTATPVSGSTFAGWSGACAGVFCTVTMNTAKSVTATFTAAPNTYTLTVNTSGTGSGTVSGAGSYAAGVTVNLVATPNAGSTFAGWSPSLCANSFAMPANNLACMATFTANGPVTTDDPATTLITHYYVSILERAPEADGLAFWQGLVADKEARGEDVKDVFRQMADFFFNSPEYIGRNTTDRQFITNLYLTFFQRAPDEAGYAFWLDQLAKGMTRRNAMMGFLYSPEFTAFMEEVLGGGSPGGPDCMRDVPPLYLSCSQTSERAVQKAYIAYYGRPADPSGLENWCSQIDDEGGRLDTMMDAFGNSQEFNDRYGLLSNEALLESVYQQIFGHSPDPAAKIFWLAKLESDEVTLQSIPLNILNGAQGDDLNIIENKNQFAQSATRFFAYRGVNSVSAYAIKSVMAIVNADPASIENATNSLCMITNQDQASGYQWSYIDSGQGSYISSKIGEMNRPVVITINESGWYSFDSYNSQDTFLMLNEDGAGVGEGNSGQLRVYLEPRDYYLTVWDKSGQTSQPSMFNFQISSYIPDGKNPSGIAFVNKDNLAPINLVTFKCPPCFGCLKMQEQSDSGGGDEGSGHHGGTPTESEVLSGGVCRGWKSYGCVEFELKEINDSYCQSRYGETKYELWVVNNCSQTIEVKWETKTPAHHTIAGEDLWNGGMWGYDPGPGDSWNRISSWPVCGLPLDFLWSACAEGDKNCQHFSSYLFDPDRQQKMDQLASRTEVCNDLRAP